MTGENTEKFLRAVARHAKTKALAELVKKQKKAGLQHVLLKIAENKRPGQVRILPGLVGEVRSHLPGGGTLVELAISDFEAWVEKKKSKK